MSEEEVDSVLTSVGHDKRHLDIDAQLTGMVAIVLVFCIGQLCALR